PRPAADRGETVGRRTPHRGDGHDPGAVGYERERDIDRRVVAVQVDGGVDAARLELAYALEEAIAVRDGLGAELAEQVVVGGARRRDHASAAATGKLDGRDADAAGSVVHEQGVTVLDARRGDRVHGRGACQHEPRRGLPGQRRGLRDNRVSRDDELVGVRLGRPIDAHLASDGDRAPWPERVRADRRDLAARLETEPHRQLRRILAERTAVSLVVGRVDAGRTHPDPYLARRGIAYGDIDDLQDLRATEVGGDDSSAHVVPERVARDSHSNSARLATNSARDTSLLSWCPRPEISKISTGCAGWPYENNA